MNIESAAQLAIWAGGPGSGRHPGFGEESRYHQTLISTGFKQLKSGADGSQRYGGHGRTIAVYPGGSWTSFPPKGMSGRIKGLAVGIGRQEHGTTESELHAHLLEVSK